MTANGGGPDLGAEWDLIAPPGADLASRTTGLETPDGPVRIAVDAESALHLLVPLAGDQPAPRDTRSQGVVVIGQSLEVDGELIRFTDLVCVEPNLRPVFIRLAGDVCDRIAADPTDPTATLLATVDDWRDLFRSQRERVTAAEAEGLFGELVVLRELAARAPAVALDRWTGPSGTPHDFEASGLHLEVKTSTDRSNRITVHGLDQLDPVEGIPLRLAVVRLRTDPTGQNVTDLVNEVLQLGVPRSRLRDELQQVGYDVRLPDDWDVHRWTQERLDVWVVDDNFPGLRRTELLPRRLRGIGAVISYDVQIAGCGEPLAPPDVTATFDLLAAP